MKNNNKIVYLIIVIISALVIGIISLIISLILDLIKQPSSSSFSFDLPSFELPSFDFDWSDFSFDDLFNQTKTGINNKKYLSYVENTIMQNIGGCASVYELYGEDDYLAYSYDSSLELNEYYYENTSDELVYRFTDNALYIENHVQNVRIANWYTVSIIVERSKVIQPLNIERIFYQADFVYHVNENLVDVELDFEYHNTQYLLSFTLHDDGSGITWDQTMTLEDETNHLKGNVIFIPVSFDESIGRYEEINGFDYYSNVHIKPKEEYQLIETKDFYDMIKFKL